jgi:FtsP/CotA-like multicopper oxidase with cupredoxin domain
MTVMAVDGTYVTPMTVDFLDMFSGERYDVPVVADQPVGNYEFRAWILNYKGHLEMVDKNGTAPEYWLFFNTRNLH